MTGTNDQNIFLEIYRRLYRRYGPQGWWPGESGPLDVIVGAILTQSAAWTNVEQALNNLKAADCWSMEAIHRIDQADLAEIIRPCGYFNSKARKLKAFAAQVHDRHGGDLHIFLDQDVAPLRVELLSIYGIGPETADDILVYAAGKPSFVIDSYTRRTLSRMGLAPQGESKGKSNDYHSYQSLFHHSLPPDPVLFNEYHALLDEHAKRACAKTPLCQDCCLRDLCATGKLSMNGVP